MKTGTTHKRADTNHTLLSVYTKVEQRVAPGVCYFCGKRVCPADEVEAANGRGGYLAICNGEIAAMHGSRCGE